MFLQVILISSCPARNSTLLQPPTLFFPSPALFVKFGYSFHSY